MLQVDTEKAFEKEVLKASQPVLVHFWAPWCGLCRMINPMLLKLQTNPKQPIKLVTVNADENFKLANTYRLKNLPTLLLFEDGNLLKRLDEFNGREGILNNLEKIVSSDFQQSA